MGFSNEDILFEATNLTELHLIVLPTEKCNFRCRYCYENHSAPKMNSDIEISLINFIGSRLPSLKYLTIDWFGGEPLLGLQIIRRVNNYVLSSEWMQNKKLWFRSGITTNGYLLTSEVFEELISLGVVQYQITIDGTKDIHDTTRILANGGKSFDKIWSNIISMKNSPKHFDVLLRLHLMKKNIAHIDNLIRFIESELGSDHRFKLFLKPIKNLGGSGADFCANESLTDGENIASNLQKTLVTNSEFWSPNPICHASKLNSYIIRADGRIAKCTTALEDPVNTIGKIASNGNLELDREKILLWSRGIFDMNLDQLYCPYSGIHSASL